MSDGDPGQAVIEKIAPAIGQRLKTLAFIFLPITWPFTVLALQTVFSKECFQGLQESNFFVRTSNCAENELMITTECPNFQLKYRECRAKKIRWVLAY